MMMMSKRLIALYNQSSLLSQTRGLRWYSTLN